MNDDDDDCSRKNRQLYLSNHRDHNNFTRGDPHITPLILVRLRVAIR